jgi:hypothetical protein
MMSMHDLETYGIRDDTHGAQLKLNFREMNEDVKFTEIKKPDGETIEVLKDHFFIVAWFNSTNEKQN